MSYSDWSRIWIFYQIFSHKKSPYASFPTLLVWSRAKPAPDLSIGFSTVAFRMYFIRMYGTLFPRTVVIANCCLISHHPARINPFVKRNLITVIGRIPAPSSSGIRGLGFADEQILGIDFGYHPPLLSVLFWSIYFTSQNMMNILILLFACPAASSPNL